MAQSRIWCGVVLLAFLAACGCSRKGDAFFPTTSFVAGLKKDAEQLVKTELVRFNEIEQASKNRVRFEYSNNPMTPGAGAYFKMYREYTAAQLKEVRRSDSYITPIVYDIVFKYRLFATPIRHTDFPDSPQKVKEDQEFSFLREDSATVNYHCDASGKLAEPLPDLLPRDGLMDPSWQKRLLPGDPVISPVQDPPPLGPKP